MPVVIDARKGELFTEVDADRVSRIHMYDAPASLQSHAWGTMTLVPALFEGQWWTVGTFTYQGNRVSLACLYHVYAGRAHLSFGIVTKG
jgi:hypothetical protein